MFWQLVAIGWEIEEGLKNCTRNRTENGTGDCTVDHTVDSIED